uniref:AlNc14C205G8803 protein n=1 Tax=Albugo laibachii Nc14 TaxID=890382 RepID=F0WQZ5_9STRA|nr:AlNc14C205G8803 [Albugo laibachii Nc14]|eukprot:CCA23755.1 AlNc14C205G8803 [Albugo laibachii Nc14]
MSGTIGFRAGSANYQRRTQRGCYENNGSNTQPENTYKKAELLRDTMGIVDTKHLHGLAVTSRPKLRWTCIKGKLGDAKDRPHIPINSFFYFLTILTDNENEHRCPKRYTVKILTPEECLESLKNHVIDIGIHRLPPASK